MKPHATKTDQAAQQDYGERSLQLLCVIAQSLARIEKQLGVIPQQERKVIAFSNGGQR